MLKTQQCKWFKEEDKKIILHYVKLYNKKATISVVAFYFIGFKIGLGKQMNNLLGKL